MERAACLRRVPIFCNLEPGILATLAEIAHQQHYHKGQIIYYRGDPGNSMYVLLTGAVELTLPSDTGSEVLVARLRPGEHFGELAVLDGQPRSVTAVAAEETQVLAIARDQLVGFLREHGQASLQVALSLCLRLRHVTELLADMAFLDLLSRVAKRLCEMAGIFQTVPAGPVEVHVNQEALAEMVGASRESVNRQLSKLREMALLQTGRGRVRILRPDRLRALARGDVTTLTLQA